MKKFLLSLIAMVALSGCTYYDYYKGDVRYTQDGDDCIYYADEYARNYSNDINGLDDNKKIVYRNTRCADLFKADHAGKTERNDRMILAPAETKVAEKTASCPMANRSVAVSDCGCDYEYEVISAYPVFYSFTGK